MKFWNKFDDEEKNLGLLIIAAAVLAEFGSHPALQMFGAVAVVIALVLAMIIYIGGEK
jgi:hypothetical protein